MNKRLVAWIAVLTFMATCYGCAALGKFTLTGAALAKNAVNVAQGLFHALDGFYGDLLDLKLVSDYTTQATRALSIADQAAMVLQAVIAGATVTEEQMNVAAGQVDGAKALLLAMEEK